MFARLATRTPSKPKTAESVAKSKRRSSDEKARDSASVGWKPAGGIQAKLAVGPADDPLEAEADRIAEQVVHRPESDRMGGAARKSAAAPGHKGSGGVPSELLGGAGRPLESSQRAFFEPRFGFDFSRVRIYSDEQAANGAQSIGALAYTAGPNIVFGHGRYQPGTAEGRRLLAHELTHVAQQGHAAAMDGRGVKVSTARAPAIQRDTPPGGTPQNIPRISITKRYLDASRAEVVQALTDYLNAELALRGTRQVAVTDDVRWAVLKLFRNNPDGYSWAKVQLSKSGLPGSPEDFAAMVGAQLPDVIPREQMMHLYERPGKAAGPTSTTGKAKEAIKGKVGELGKRPEDVGDPNGPVEAPSNAPTMGESPGQHSVKTPDIPFGGSTTRRRPAPQAPLASQGAAVDKIVQALDEKALIPAAAKGTAQEADFANAKDLARSIANQLTAAQAKKQYTVEITIGMSYRSAQDLGEIFGRIEDIVRQIARALPDGVNDVNEVIISLPPASKSDKFRARRVVKLHGGG